MRPHLFATILAATLFSSSGALAFHPADPNVRGTLDPEQLERIEFLHVQSGWYHGVRSASQARRAAREARAAVPQRLDRYDR